MNKKYNPHYNTHYNFHNPENLAEIVTVESYDILNDAETYSSGQEVLSPWGKNEVVKTWSENGIEFCLKKITINPQSMLSLQRHRGRSEIWSVTEGILTVILDGKILNLQTEQKIIIPKGSAHCMINMTNSEIVVEEIQQGICREKDNIRLMDFLGRPTYPLTSEAEYQSYLLYHDAMKTIKKL